jgi:membrane protease YdiL (CAAX protease family)
VSAFTLVLQWFHEKAGSLAAPWLVHACGDIAMMGVAVRLPWK